MNRVVSSSEMSSLDLSASRKFAIPLILLMENAGREVAQNVLEYIKQNKLTNPKVLIVAGPGNNGGDGFVAARHILSSIDKVSILLLVLAKKPYRDDAKINCEVLNKIWYTDSRIRMIDAMETRKFSAPKKFNPDIVIDAIFGTGFKGIPIGYYKKAIQMINKLSGYKIAIDIPSGVDSDIGIIEGIAVKANSTITMGLLKRGQLLYPGKEYCGQVKIANLGISYDKLDKSNTYLLDREFIAENLPKRKPNGHKGTFGSVVAVAGGKGYSGAACLTSLGALESGAGIVRLCYPMHINAAVEKKLTEVIKVPVSQTKEGTFSLLGFYKIQDIAKKSTVMAIGPGVTTYPETGELIQKVITLINLPMVIDADGLNNISLENLFKIPKRRRLETILTPHPGEFSRLFGMPVASVNRNRVDICREWAKKLSLTIVLKGAPTVIGTPDGNLYINPTGNVGLAKGGSGDVLTGMITGFIAQGVAPWIAACLGVYLHGYAADIAVGEKTEYSVTATDLIKELPKAILNIIKA